MSESGTKIRKTDMALRTLKTAREFYLVFKGSRRNEHGFRKEEGRYKANVLVSSSRRRALLFVRNSRMREKIEASHEAASRAASIALQKADIASSRTQTAQERCNNFISY